MVVFVEANRATLLLILKDIEPAAASILVALRRVAVTLGNAENELDYFTVVVHDELIDDLEGGVVDVASHDRVLQVLQPVVNIDALFDVDQAGWAAVGFGSIILLLLTLAIAAE